jgi:hypothetical protein
MYLWARPALVSFPRSSLRSLFLLNQPTRARDTSDASQAPFVVVCAVAATFKRKLLVILRNIKETKKQLTKVET